ncbi:MAG: competence/damage-inducible protein A [Bacteroidota bacterium]
MNKAVKVALLAIGDEILYGQTLDTNSHWMADQLDSYGFKLVHKATVGDNEPDILKGLKDGEDRADIILITGGLGPTADDLTKPCLAKYFDVPLESNPGALAELKALFKSINKELTQNNIIQTNLPANSDYISNSIGTAPGMWIEDNGRVFVSMPGVPGEMKAMMTNQVIPKLRDKYHLPIVVHRIIKTIGIGESWLANKIAPWEQNLPNNIGLAYLPTLGQVKLRLTSTGKDKAQLNKMMDEQVAELLPYAENYIYGYGDTKIEELIGDLLKEQGETLATAESCSGGFLAHLITSVPGSSDYFKGSIIAYSNEIKEAQLSVNPQTLENYGAVSEETIIEMAKGAKNRLNVDYAISTSGIAGPAGGTDEKPVGTIWIAVAYGDEVLTKQLKLFKDRVFNIKMTALYSLGMLWRILSK